MKAADFAFTPVVIIGAGRSGTNALRDMLTRLPDFDTWHCDEINPIWRHGNISWPNDEIPPEKATPNVQKFIRGAFKKVWTRSGKPAFIVEKTCANSLRVPFVDSVIPEAKYIYIVRSGTDVVASARKRWKGDLELPGLPYLFAKVRYTPILDLPIYAWSFMKSRFDLLLGRSERLAVWGPRFVGIEKLKDKQLEEICARQWAACVQSSDGAFGKMKPEKFLTIRYEEFALEPKNALIEILEFLGTNATDETIASAIALVRPTSIDKGQTLRNDLSSESLDAMAAALRKHGYSDG